MNDLSKGVLLAGGGLILAMLSSLFFHDGTVTGGIVGGGFIFLGVCTLAARYNEKD